MQVILLVLYKTSFYRVPVYILHLLIKHFYVQYLNWFIVLLPKLPFIIIAVLHSGSLHQPNHPFLSTLARMFCYSISKHTRCKTFHFAYNFI